MAGFRPRFWDIGAIDKGTLARINTPTSGPTCQAAYTPKPGGDPRSLIPIKDLIGYVKEVEKAYPFDTPDEIVTRIRTLYYSGPSFAQLIRHAHYSDANNYPRDLRREDMTGKAGEDAYDHLSAKADESAVRDNPSPYVILPNCDRIDVGHFLLGLEAQIYPGSGAPYRTYNVPTIDPADWPADVGTAVVWMEWHRNNGQPFEGPGSPPKSALPTLPPNPTEADYKAMEERYWQLAAPAEDILGDADSYGLYEVWIASGKPKLSQLLQSYYVDTGGKVAVRWQVFCSSKENDFTYTRTGNSITWDQKVRDKWIPRIDAFNHMYAAGYGTLKAVVNPFWKPPPGWKWKYTPIMLERFLNWVKAGLELELSQKP